MRLRSAVVYFLGEAVTGLGRSWKVSLLAVLTIAVSLFTGGLFLVVSGNLSRVASEWRSEARIVVYLTPETSEQGVVAVRSRVETEPWIDGVEQVTQRQAAQRFVSVFPSLASLLTGWNEAPLPPSLEIAYDSKEVPPETVRSWVLSVAGVPGVEMVDDDRQWLEQVSRLVVVIRSIGLALGAILLAAAIFTIASVVRLTAFLYREEIGIMRLVGATELFIRGPFLTGGLLQGLLGGMVAIVGLFAAFELLGARHLPTLLGSTLLSSFLSLPQLGALVGLGGVAGVLGAALSLRREAAR